MSLVLCNWVQISRNQNSENSAWTHGCNLSCNVACNKALWGAMVQFVECNIAKVELDCTFATVFIFFYFIFSYKATNYVKLLTILHVTLYTAQRITLPYLRKSTLLNITFKRKKKKKNIDITLFKRDYTSFICTHTYSYTCA